MWNILKSTCITGSDTTYKELKLNVSHFVLVWALRSDTTYKELKLLLSDSMNALVACSDTTYKELKQG